MEYGREIMVFIWLLPPQNALIGMDMQMYESRRTVGDYSTADSGYGDVVPFDYDFIEVNI